MSVDTFVVTLQSVLQIILSWLLLVGGARRCQVELNHYAAHNRIFQNKVANRILVEINSTLFFIQDYAGYLADHVNGTHAHHRGNIFCGPHDPDWTFLRLLGLREGMTRRQCWFWLLRTCISPRFHWIFLMARAKANFFSPNTYRRVMTFVWLTLAITLTTAYGMWFPVLLLWVFPLTFLYQISALIQFTSEHKWASPFVPGESPRERHARLSHARYCITPMPSPANSQGGLTHTLAILGWIAIVVLIDVPARVAIIVGDLPVHDRHHRFAAEKSWAAAIYLPEDESVALPSPAYWGLIGALNGVFDHLAALPAEAA
jgi:hypothetical protein